jgi:IS30 family transposase
MSSHNLKKLAIDERRRQVASYLARSMTQQEIADKIGCDRSAISDDVKALRLMSQEFIYDLAKSDLAFYYKDCNNGVEECRREAWRIFHRYDENAASPEYAKVKLMALKVAIQQMKLSTS